MGGGAEGLSGRATQKRTFFCGFPIGYEIELPMHEIPERLKENFTVNSYILLRLQCRNTFDIQVLRKMARRMLSQKLYFLYYHRYDLKIIKKNVLKKHFHLFSRDDPRNKISQKTSIQTNNTLRLVNIFSR